MSEQHPAKHPAEYVIHYAKTYHRFVAAVALGAAFVVMRNPPVRFDLMIAEFLGTALVVASVPVVLMRLFRLRDSAPILVLTLALAVSLAQPKVAGKDAEEHAVSRRSLPTASEGFGAYPTSDDTRHTN